MRGRHRLPFRVELILCGRATEAQGNNNCYECVTLHARTWEGWATKDVRCEDSASRYCSVDDSQKLFARLRRSLCQTYEDQWRDTGYAHIVRPTSDNASAPRFQTIVVDLRLAYKKCVVIWPNWSTSFSGHGVLNEFTARELTEHEPWAIHPLSKGRSVRGGHKNFDGAWQLAVGLFIAFREKW